MFRILTAFALGVATAVAGGAALLLHGGLAARQQPAALEAGLARRARALALPSEARARENPLPASERILVEGRAHFADHCASCHGNDGSGRTELGRNLYPRSPDLRGEATQRLTDGELFWVIENGIRFTGMPAWGAGNPEESWKLVHFIRHLPRLTDAERAEMERQNPRSPSEWRELEEEDTFLRGGQAPPPAGGHHH